MTQRLLRTRAIGASTRAAAIGALVIAISGGLAVLSVPSEALDQAVQGRVFRDYNLDGTFDIAVDNSALSATATDVGVPLADVRAFDTNGVQLGATAVTATDGTYTVLGTGPNGNDVRIQVTPPGTYVPGPHNNSAGTTVEFVKSGATGVDIALSMPGDYATPAPRLVNAQQLAAINNPFPNGVPALVDPADQPSLVSSAWATRDASTPAIEATVKETGSIWGVAVLDGKWAFSAAFFKKHTRTGPGGLGQIYLTDLATAGPDADTWQKILLPGDNPRTTYDLAPPEDMDGNADDWFHDGQAFQAVGTIGLGGLALAPDERSVYVVNLARKSMYRVPFHLDGDEKPVAEPPVEILMPRALTGAEQGCAAGLDHVRPFGLAAHDGSIWATLTCTGTTEDALRGYVYRYDVGSGQFDGKPAFEMALGNYDRGSNGGLANTRWKPWDLTPTLHTTPCGFTCIEWPQPLLSDVAFDSNGDMSIGIKDRNADQSGDSVGRLNHADGDTVITGAGDADAVRACRISLSPPAWALESDGVCAPPPAVGGRTGFSTTNNEGPGGGEFYFDDLTFNNPVHRQMSLGGLLQVPGFGQIVDMQFDPLGEIRSNGYRFLDNFDGSLDGGRTTLRQANGANGNIGGFGKAGGMGDMDALIARAPIEIGNRVWLDVDRDGRQDPGEAPIAGVTVSLYRERPNQTPLYIASATTDSAGRYFFSSRANPYANPIDDPSPTSALYGLDLDPFTGYTLRLDNNSNFISGGILNPYTLTTPNTPGDDSIDSDGVSQGGQIRTAVFTIDGPGINDHTFDFGFHEPVPPTSPPGGPPSTPGDPGDPGDPEDPGDPDDPGDEDTAGGGLPGTGAGGGALLVLGLTTLLAGLGMRSVRRRKGDHR